LTLLAVVGLTALGCGADVPGQPFQAAAPPAPAAISPGSPVRGELMSYIFTFEDGRTDEQFFLRTAQRRGAPVALRYPAGHRRRHTLEITRRP
jgi:hypothetical protein